MKINTGKSKILHRLLHLQGRKHKTFRCDIRKDRTSDKRNGSLTSENGVELVAKPVTPVAKAAVSSGKNTPYQCRGWK